MDSRERTFLTLNFETPDRIPRDFWASRGCRAKLAATYKKPWEDFLDLYDIDLRYIPGPQYTGPALAASASGTQEDIWGVPRKTVSVATGDGVESYEEVNEHPLACATCVEDVLGYRRWPSASWFDYSGIQAQCEAVRKKGRVAVFMGDRLNRIAQLKPAMYLRGIENILVDLSLNPDIAHAIFDKISAFYCEYEQRILEAANGKLDILLTGDDFGSQAGPLISPRMWEDFLGNGFAAYVRLAKGHGVKVMHHTCGSIRPLVPYLLERGLDILQSLQPEAVGMDAAGLKNEFGKKLCFHGGISIQRTLPFGTPREVAQDVKSKAEVLGAGGGYILCTSHNIQADAPIKNIEALLTAYETYGKY